MTLSAADAHHLVINHQRDLQTFWRALMGGGGFDQREVWVALFDDDRRPLPVLMPIGELPAEPDPLIEGFGTLLAGVADEKDVASVALLLARPGDATPTGRDRRWARALIGACGRAAPPLWPLHLATRDRVSRLNPYDLG